MNIPSALLCDQQPSRNYSCIHPFLLHCCGTVLIWIPYVRINVMVLLTTHNILVVAECSLVENIVGVVVAILECTWDCYRSLRAIGICSINYHKQNTVVYSRPGSNVINYKLLYKLSIFYAQFIDMHQIVCKRTFAVWKFPRKLRTMRKLGKTNGNEKLHNNVYFKFSSRPSAPLLNDYAVIWFSMIKIWIPKRWAASINYLRADSCLTRLSSVHKYKRQIFKNIFFTRFIRICGGCGKKLLLRVISLRRGTQHKSHTLF